MAEKSPYTVEPLGGLSPTKAFGALSGLPLPFLLPARAASIGADPGSADHNSALYTYAGAAPSVTVVTDLEGNTTVTTFNKETRSARDPFYAISDIIKERGNHKTKNERNPFPFSGGAVGYFAYDLKNFLDGPNKGTPRPKRRGTGLLLPLSIVGIYDTIYVYDHQKQEAWIVTHNKSANSSADSINDSIEETGQTLAAALKAAALKNNTDEEATAEESEPIRTPDASNRKPAQFSSNTTRAEHTGAIARALKYISAGDIYQINLSHRLVLPLATAPFDLFERLTKKSPAPFASYFDAGAFQILSNSPERLVSVEGRTATVEPIKGTRPRGATEDADASLIEELKGSVKERAEHVMIVDLERNDLGRVAVPGGVRVTEFEKVVTLRGLHHMVSTVTAELRPGIDSLGVLRAVYPGGSITGAPKVRAMEIIDELECGPRSLYTGGIGWIDFRGDLDIAMAIRTAVSMNGELHLSVGGGIVADSEPEAEYEETILKALDFLELTSAQAEKSGA